jgi:alpha-tubulin suppressor-like RCC1 family protein
MDNSLRVRTPLVLIAFAMACGDPNGPSGPSKLGFVARPIGEVAGANMAVQVAIQDAAGNTVTSATGPVTIAFGANPASGTLLGTTTVTAANGVAVFNDLRIEKAGAGYTLVASSPSLTSSTSDPFSVSATAAVGLAFVTQPANVTAGASIMPGVQLAVIDQYNNVVTTATGSATMQMGFNPGLGTLSGTTTQALTGGVATFNDLSINKAAPSYTLSATSGSFNAVNSTPFNVFAGAPAKLTFAFSMAGIDYASMTPIGPPVHVNVRDALDNVVQTVSTSVTLSIGTNPSGGVLSGTLTVAAVNGTATFTNALIDKAGVGYTVVASGAGLQSATSGAFNIRVGERSQVVFLDQMPASIGAGIVLPSFRVAVRDAGGNLVADPESSIFVSVNTSSNGGRVVTFPFNQHLVNTVGGIATFDAIKLDKPGTYTLKAQRDANTGESNAFAVQLAFARVTVGGGPVASTPITESRYSCTVSTLGVLHCWGGSITGAMGIEAHNAQASVLLPELVVTDQLFKDVDAGRYHTCAVTPAGALYCWGFDIDQQLGNGAPEGTLAHPAVIAPALHFVSVSAGDEHTCGVTSSGPGVLSGPAYCWGGNRAGQLGDGTFDQRDVPTLVAGGHTFIAVSASHGEHTCGITTAFLTYCWGRNVDGQLGDNSTTDRNVPTLVQDAGTHLFRSISTGLAHTCAVRADNAAYCWGANTNQQIGDGNTATTDRPTPSLVTGAFTSVSAGWTHTCGISAAGGAQCWGGNAGGQLGDGGTTERNAPAPVSGSLALTAVSAGVDFSCGVTTDNRLYCWGRNDFGQLGDGSTTQRLTPVRVFP